MRPISLHNVARKKWRPLLANSRRLASGKVTHECDVVIVGGGLVGLALASALGSSRIIRKSLRIALVEASDLSRIREWTASPGQFSNRVSSLTTASQTFLKGIGVWSHLDATRMFPMEEMQVWDGISDARVTFSAPELGIGAPDSASMALMTENFNLQSALLKHLRQIQDVELLDQVKVSSIERDSKEGGRWPTVHLSDGRMLRTRLLVGADGFNSPVRIFAGISSYGWHYDAQAIVATLSHIPRSSHQKANIVAYQRFLSTGPIAFLPLSATESSLVWSTKPPLARALLKVHPAVLSRMINAAFRLPHVSMQYLHQRILDADASGLPISPTEIQEEISWREKSHSIDPHSAYTSSVITSPVGIPQEDSGSVPPLVTSIQQGSAASFPLRFNHADAYIGERENGRTALVGDAAHTVHPLAGQGLNMGLADVECLAHCIQDAVLSGGDVGSYTALLPYARKRYFENHAMMAAIDKLHKIYSSTSEPLVWARSVGVEIINEIDPFKAALMYAAGANPRNTPTGARGQGWAQVTVGIESLARGVNVAKLVGGGIVGGMGIGLQKLFNSVQQQYDKTSQTRDN